MKKTMTKEQIERIKFLKEKLNKLLREVDRNLEIIDGIYTELKKIEEVT